jgi:hypothetical protein
VKHATCPGLCPHIARLPFGLNHKIDFPTGSRYPDVFKALESLRNGLRKEI